MLAWAYHDLIPMVKMSTAFMNHKLGLFQEGKSKGMTIKQEANNISAIKNK